MGNPIDAMGRCIVCGKRCESTGGCDCLLIESQARPVGEVMAVVPDAELAALKQKLDQAENRERLALTEIKTLKDEKAALEARFALAVELAEATESIFTLCEDFAKQRYPNDDLIELTTEPHRRQIEALRAYRAAKKETQ